MMAGNPNNWWSSLHTHEGHHHHHHHHHQLPPNFLSESPATPAVFPLQYFHGSASSLFPSGTLHPLAAPAGGDAQEYPHSWSQLLMGGLATADGEAADRFSPSHFQPRKLDSWDGNMNSISANHSSDHDRAKEEDRHVQNNSSSYRHEEQEVFLGAARASPWPQILPASSPKSCVTSSLNSSILDFSSSSKATQWNQHADNSSECNSSAIGGASKKARVQPSSTSSSTLKVRKEKLGDRITTLHQLVSPFGKTDTASVLLEAIGYIRFLQGQIEALSSPYMGNAADKNQHSEYMMGDASNKDLKSRGLCLVPISCTQLVGSDNGADYWAAAPSFNGGF